MWPFHRHKWEAKQVQHVLTSQKASYPFENLYWTKPMRPETLILKVCECGESRTKTQLGTWELEDL